MQPTAPCGSGTRPGGDATALQQPEVGSEQGREGAVERYAHGSVSGKAARAGVALTKGDAPPPVPNGGARAACNGRWQDHKGRVRTVAAGRDRGPGPGAALRAGGAHAPHAPETRSARASTRFTAVADHAASPPAGEGTPRPEREPGAKKVRLGTVVSDKGDKTITVKVEVVHRHRRYEKVIRRSDTLHAHDERNEAGAGDTVRFAAKSSTDEEVHVHGYDISKDAPAGKTIRMSFEADIEGIFEIEFERSAVPIASLRVEP